MQRLTNSFDGVSGQWSPWSYILNKSENATPELFAIYMQNLVSQKANESVSERLGYA